MKKGIGQRKVRPVWNNAMRTIIKNYSNSRSKYSSNSITPPSLALVSISTARQSSSRAAALVSTAMPIKTVTPKPFVNIVKSIPNAFQKSYSPSRRSFYQHTTLKNRNLDNRVNNVKWSQVPSYHIGDVDAPNRFEATSKRPMIHLSQEFDQERKEADDIDWSKIIEHAQKRQSGSMIRYQVLKKKPVPIAKALGSEPSQEQSTEEPTELYEEDLKEMLEIVPAYQGFEDMLKGFNREDLDTLWSLVKGRFRPAEPSKDMEKALWVKLKRLFESDKDDVLWKLQRYMHDPLTWRLYGSSGVHHVSSTRGQDIFMLVEKDYLLTKGLAILMLSNKLRVDQQLEMADEFFLTKINNIANRLRK
ncbi:hypothetical protein Tco_0349364 [Tanacetum coccineum]